MTSKQRNLARHAFCKAWAQESEHDDRRIPSLSYRDAKLVAHDCGMKLDVENGAAWQQSQAEYTERTSLRA